MFEKKTTLLKTFSFNNKFRMPIASSDGEFTSTVFAIKNEYNFLWWRWVVYVIKSSIPFIEDPFFDSEYLINHQLSMTKKSLEAKAEEIILIEQGKDPGKIEYE